MELPSNLEALARLIGSWSGPGEGTYPTSRSFSYQETITFTCNGKPFLEYVQRTKSPDGQPLHTAVSILLPGRRANGPEKNVPPLCSFSPIHYLELPEFFADAITSMTGKSPSTTGAGSEGALTKGPVALVVPAAVSLLYCASRGERLRRGRRGREHRGR